MFEKNSHFPSDSPQDEEIPRPEKAYTLEELGDFLRRVRERRRTSLNEVAKTTKVRLRYLEALERGNLRRLPGYLYGKGYLQSYLSFLDENPTPWAKRYEELVGLKGGEEGDTRLGESRKLLWRCPWLVFLLLGLLAVLVLVGWLARDLI